MRYEGTVIRYYVMSACVAVCVSLNVSVCLSHYCWVESVCDAAVDCSGSRWSISTTKSSVISSSQNQMELLPSWWVQRPNHLLLSRCFYVCLYPQPPSLCLPLSLPICLLFVQSRCRDVFFYGPSYQTMMWDILEAVGLFSQLCGICCECYCFVLWWSLLILYVCIFPL